MLTCNIALMLCKLSLHFLDVHQEALKWFYLQFDCASLASSSADVILVSQSVLYSLWREIYCEITPCKADADFILDSYQR